MSKSEEKQSGSRARLWLAIGILLLVGGAIIFALSSNVESRIMAPGPSYGNEVPLEDADGGS